MSAQPTSAEGDRIALLAAQDREAADRRVAEEGPAFWEGMAEVDAKIAAFRRERKRELGYAVAIYRRSLLQALSVPVQDVSQPAPTPPRTKKLLQPEVVS